ncbi:unnamed protein product [Lupinus luteus]|uniref:glycerophosphodiester phosphodiesterase n=1 Tax=Lupinus luteus TaxID=3873 RepID=A0AAV1XN38_LUPLU
MALKAVHVSDVSSLDIVPESPSFSLYSTRFSDGVEMSGAEFKVPKFLVIGHRGHGMNALQSLDRRMKAIKENSITSFNAAASFPIDYIEFDVQGTLFEKRIIELCLCEFLAYGPQREAGKEGKALLRRNKDGKIVQWDVEQDDTLCTLEEVFLNVHPSLGFNIELKFDDHTVYEQDYLLHVLKAILKVVFDHAKDRPIIFSTFQPDAASLVKKLQSAYPVFFLTNGGCEIYEDVRRNSLEEALKLCLENGLEGIVSEIKGVFRNPGVVTKIKESQLSLLTYGALNNVPEAVYIQHLMGIDGVIVDLVQEITEVVANLITSAMVVDEEGLTEGIGKLHNKPQFSQKELSFLLNLIPKLIQL